jgi:AraC-like DNA-binding protein
VPRPPLDGLIDDLYYLAGTPPYARLTLPPPAALLIVNLGAPFRIRAGTDIETAEYADGCVVTTPTRALEFGYPLRTRPVGVHVKPWGLAPFLPMPAAELCDRPVTVEQVWGRPAVAELRDRLATADGPHEMLTLLEEELMRRLCETAGLGLVRHTSSVIAATSGAVAIGDLSVAAGVSSTHLAQRFKELIGVTPKRLARTYRFAATVFAINPAGPIDWGELAGGAGYFDQAHFGHEFRAFTGLTPTHDTLTWGSPEQRRAPWARWSCTARCRWTASSRTRTTSPDRCSTGCPAVTSRWTRAARSRCRRRPTTTPGRTGTGSG